MRVKTWRILDRGKVPTHARTIPWTCHCGHEAQLPIVGHVEAVLGGYHSKLGDDAIVFDPAEDYAMPSKIQCRRCGRVYGR